jgi:hypothetical protein
MTIRNVAILTSAIAILAGCQTTAGPIDQSQSMLNRMGYNAGPVDGAYGKKTRGALEAFYADTGGSYDGKLDANEVADLQAAMAERGIQAYVPLSSYEIERSFSANPDKRDLIVTSSQHSRAVGQGVFWYGHQTAVGDWNNDGIDDIITVGVSNIANGRGKDYFPGGKCAAYSDWRRMKTTGECKMDTIKIKPRIAWGKADGTFEMSTGNMFIHDPAVGKPQGFEHAMDVFPADFNGDGIADFFIPDTGHANRKVHSALYLSNGDDTWTYATYTNVKGLKTQFAHGGNVADIDSDGDIDIVMTNQGRNLTCWINDGKGNFKTKSNCISTPDPILTISFADTDGDGDLDMYTGSNSFGGTEAQGGWLKYGGGYRIYENTGKGRFRQQAKLDNHGCWVTNWKSETFDYDGDGDYDFVAIMVGDSYAFSALKLIENKGNGKWETQIMVVNDLDDVDPAKFHRRTYKVGHGNDKCGFYSFNAKKQKWIHNTWEGSPLNQSPSQLQLADADGDGRKDIIMINPQAMEGFDVTRPRIHGGYFRNLGGKTIAGSNWLLVTARPSSDVVRLRY